MSTVTVFYNSVRGIDFDIKDKNGNTIVVKINGSNSLVKDPITGEIIKSASLPLAGAYGITKNVDAEAWAEVEKVYGSMSIFTKGFIRASKPGKEEGAKEVVANKANGDEPVKPKKSRKKAAADD